MNDDMEKWADDVRNDPRIIELLENERKDVYYFPIDKEEQQIIDNLGARLGEKLKYNADSLPARDLQEALQQNAAFRGNAVRALGKAAIRLSKLNRNLNAARKWIDVRYPVGAKKNGVTNADAESMLHVILEPIFWQRDALVDFAARGKMYLEEFTDMRFTLSSLGRQQERHEV